MRNLLFIAALLCSNVAFSQNDKNGFVSFNVGAAIPNGDFADDNTNRTSSGLAKTGFMADLNFGYRISENFGIMGKVRHQTHKFKTNALEDDFRGPSYLIDVDAGKWKTTGGYAGLFVSLPLAAEGGVGVFEFRGLVGLTGSTDPEIEVNIGDYSYSEKITMHSVKASSIGIIFGAGVKLFLSENLAFNINADYFSTNADFEEGEVTIESSDGFKFEGETNDYEQSIQTINLTMGLSLLF